MQHQATQQLAIDFSSTEAYWGVDRSTKVLFEPGREVLTQDNVTACFVFAVVGGNSLVMVRPGRGWGLPGGHMEPGETAEECARREVSEEAAVDLGELSLVGWWRAKKEFSSAHNEKYPSEAVQLLYLAEVTSVNQFSPEHEVFERAFVPFEKVADYHSNFERFEAVLKYGMSLLA